MLQPICATTSGEPSAVRKRAARSTTWSWIRERTIGVDGPRPARPGQPHMGTRPYVKARAYEHADPMVLAEICRVLRPGGRLQLADIARALHSTELVQVLAEAGFRRCRIASRSTVFSVPTGNSRRASSASWEMNVTAYR